MSTYQRLAAAFTAALVLGLGPVASNAQSAAKSANQPELKVGDRWKTERRDSRTNAVLSASEMVVTTVTPTRIDASSDGSPVIMTRDLTVSENSKVSNDPGYEYLRFPIEVGKKWDFKTTWRNKSSGNTGRTQMDVEVKGQERIKVAAGELDAFKLEARGIMNFDSGGNRSVVATYWYAPEARSIARLEWVDRRDDFVFELVGFTLTP